MPAEVVLRSGLPSGDGPGGVVCVVVSGDCRAEMDVGQVDRGESLDRVNTTLGESLALHSPYANELSTDDCVRSLLDKGRACGRGAV